MVSARCRLTFAAAVAAWIASTISGFAYAPRLAPPGIPSSPSADVVTSAEALGEVRFTLNPRMGFFAAGDPINGMDPDGRFGKGFNSGATFSARMFEGFGEGHLSQWNYDASGQQVVDWGNGQAFYTGLSSSASMSQKLGHVVGGGLASLINAPVTFVNSGSQATDDLGRWASDAVGLNWEAAKTLPFVNFLEFQQAAVAAPAVIDLMAARLQAARAAANTLTTSARFEGLTEAQIQTVQAAMREAGVSAEMNILIKGADMPPGYTGMTLGDEGFVVNRAILDNRQELVKTIQHELKHVLDRRALGDPGAYGSALEDAARAAENP